MKLCFVGSSLSRTDYETIREANLPVEYLALENLLSAMRIRISSAGVALDLGEAECILRGAHVWYHPGRFDLLEETLVTKDTELNFVARQFRVALAWLERWIAENCVCIDTPAIQRKWSSKIEQLSCFTRHAPEALLESSISCDISLLREGWVVKHLSESRIISSTEAFYTQRLDRQSIQALMNTDMPMPVNIQEFISSSNEYRTYCFGNELSTVVLPRDEATSVVDVHFHPAMLRNTKVEDTRAPRNLIRRLGEATGLRFFAVDYILRDSSPALLEVNPLFSWNWMSAACVDDVLDSFARFMDSPTVGAS